MSAKHDKEIDAGEADLSQQIAEAINQPGIAMMEQMVANETAGMFERMYHQALTEKHDLEANVRTLTEYVIESRPLVREITMRLAANPELKRFFSPEFLSNPLLQPRPRMSVGAVASGE